MIGRELEEALSVMRNPAHTLPLYGSVMDQESGEVITYDPDRIAPYLHRRILSFVHEKRRIPSGHRKWGVVLASRQTGKSALTAKAMYVQTAYTPNSYAALIADTSDRAVDIFRHINTCHEGMPDDVRMDTIPNRESRQITFSHRGVIRTASEGANMVGIGRSYDYVVMSEIPFWKNAAGAWNGLYPAVTNRKEACVIFESTPAPMYMPSAEFYADICAEARKGLGRWEFMFAPFFSSRLNERPWGDGWTFTSEEISLLERFGPQGRAPMSAPGEVRYLTLENLAFRRETMAMDPLIKREPDLFYVFFPVDPVTCWMHVGGGAIPKHAVREHLGRVVVPWNPLDGKYQEYLQPDPNAPYIISVDPAGWMGHDQACFHVLEAYAGRWGLRQAATYSTNESNPHVMARYIIEAAEKYNNAEVIVENNGVGAGVVALLELASTTGLVIPDENGTEKRYYLKNLYYHKLASKAGSRPGIPAGTTTNAEALARLIDALMERLVIYDEETLDQVVRYRRDKEVEDSERWRIMNPTSTGSGKRSKHHWDRVSALMWGCYLAYRIRQRYKPSTPEETQAEQERMEAEVEKGLTHNQTEALRRDIARTKKGRDRASRKTKSIKKTRTKRRRRR